MLQPTGRHHLRDLRETGSLQDTVMHQQSNLNSKAVFLVAAAMPAGREEVFRKRAWRATPGHPQKLQNVRSHDDFMRSPAIHVSWWPALFARPSFCVRYGKSV